MLPVGGRPCKWFQKEAKASTAKYLFITLNKIIFYLPVPSLQFYFLNLSIILQIFTVPLSSQISSKVGYIIGLHYPLSATKPIVTRMLLSELCCGVGSQDLGPFLGRKPMAVFVGTQLSGFGSLRTAGIAAYITSCKFGRTIFIETNKIPGLKPISNCFTLVGISFLG